MPVIDASVLVDAFVNDGPPGAAARAELVHLSVLDVPHIFQAEATSALRGLLHRRAITEGRALSALDHVRAVSVAAYPFEPFLGRVWELRDNMTVYDAWYIALAESLGTELVTSDERLKNAPGPRCAIRLPQTNR